MYNMAIMILEISTVTKVKYLGNFKRKICIYTESEKIEAPTN